MRPIHRRLLAWYDAHARDLPWRATRDPYAVWVSEAMLQQTQVATVLPYYRRWMEAFPTLEALAEATEEEALAQWQGLGYYRRARHLAAGARFMRERGVPASAEEWRRVPGVGRYTAGALASILAGERAPAVDGNVERVYARLAADRRSGAALRRAAWEWAARAVSRERPGDWNQALMELGATVCAPRRPRCPECPLRTLCRARRSGLETELPTPAPRPAPVAVSMRLAVPWQGGSFGLARLPEGGWWAGMWGFPEELAGDSSALGTIRHTVTRHRLEIECRLVAPDARDASLRWCRAEEAHRVPMPVPHRRALRLALDHLARARDGAVPRLSPK